MMIRLRRTLLLRFWRDRRGVSAIEFAIIAPVMIAIYFGVGELSGGMMSSRRASDVASTIGDLTAQCPRVNQADLDDIFGAATTLMKPFPTTALKMRLSSVSMNANRTLNLDWSKNKNYSDAGSVAALGLPANMLSTPGESVVVAEAVYTYTSTAAYVVKNGLTVNKKFFLSPRKVGIVKFTSSGANTACADS